MELYNLYAGLSGGFGGYQYHCTEEYNSKDEALEAARQLAIEEYQSYAGCHGLTSEEDILEQYLKDNGLSHDELTESDYEEIWDMYMEEVEGWLSYLATTIEEDPDHDRYYEW